MKGGYADGSVERSLLDTSCHKSPFENPYQEPWPRRKKRFFQRSMSGIEVAWGNREQVRFLSLTSSPESPEDIHRSWGTLVKRIRREFGVFEYIAVKEFTVSGLQHIHALFRGCYIPQAWVKENWQAVHRAKIVYIEGVKGNRKQVANYLSKYLGKLDQRSYRFWCSSKWCFKGFVGFWKLTVREYQKEAVAKWRYFLHGGIIRFTRWRPWGEGKEYWKFEGGVAVSLPHADLGDTTV